MCFIADIVSALEFDPTGKFLAAGDRGGRLVLFMENRTKVFFFLIYNLYLRMEIEKKVSLAVRQNLSFIMNFRAILQNLIA